jgi:DNA-binding MarR family transcriptional regulator
VPHVLPFESAIRGCAWSHRAERIRSPLLGQNRPMSTLTAAREAEISKRLLKHWHEAVPNDRMAHMVKDAARSFLRSLQARLGSEGVSLGHWTFLRILWEQDGLTQRELSQDAGVMEPTTVVALRAMEELGYITRERLPDNRKNIYVFLTPGGKALKKRLVPLAEEVNTFAIRGLKQADVETTRRCLLVMLNNLARDPALGESGAASGK